MSFTTEKTPYNSKSTFDDLVNDLNCSDHQRSHEAKKKLISLGHTVIRDLIEMLPSASNKSRFRIIMTLCETKDKSLIPDLLPYLQSDNSTIQAVVAQFIGEFGDESAIEPLIGQLTQNTEIYSHTWTIQALGKLRAKKAVKPLIEIMHKADSGSTRYTAIEALGLIGDSSAISEINRYINDSDHHVSDRAKAALNVLSNGAVTGS